MEKVGVREIKDRVSEILREVEHGQSFVVTVHGREVADLTPHQAPAWTTWEGVHTIFDLPADPDLLVEIEGAGTTELTNPWEQQ